MKQQLGVLLCLICCVIDIFPFFLLYSPQKQILPLTDLKNIKSLHFATQALLVHNLRTEIKSVGMFRANAAVSKRSVSGFYFAHLVREFLLTKSRSWHFKSIFDLKMRRAKPTKGQQIPCTLTNSISWVWEMYYRPYTPIQNGIMIKVIIVREWGTRK